MTADGKTRSRPVARVVDAKSLKEGGGFPVRRPFPVAGFSFFDPFLLLDEMGPVDWPPNAAIGAPPHPHRGFETVTYLLDGAMQHRDSGGHAGDLNPGDVQWMTAGAGVVHSELPHPDFQKTGGRMHGFQLWVNLPAAEKMIAPRYQDIPASEIPKACSADGKVEVTVIAGECLGEKAVIDTRIPITYLHLCIHPGGGIEQPLSVGHNAVAYVFDGRLLVGEAKTSVVSGQAALLGDGDRVRLAVSENADGPAQLLLLAGPPLNEPVARHGPFVMNTAAEIEQAIIDYRDGRLGGSID
ncbi:MAG: pirin family protein [Gammaproteobacteria bacterium]|nr:pirin family protein [Gammaproteobacteria bacterium]MCP5136090.1 pirin family protein [Gammaproteobacteria bacterium]